MSGHQKNRMSTYSNPSIQYRGHNRPATQMSTTTLLNSLHASYVQGQAYSLESSSSIAINSWLTASTSVQEGLVEGVVDQELAKRAWEHARRRAEDGCIILGSPHESSPSLLTTFVSAVPVSISPTFYHAISALRPFFSCVTPQNSSRSRYTALAVALSLSLTGELTGTSLAISTSGIDTRLGLVNVPSQKGFRAFDVFYYMLKSATDNEREFLELQEPAAYALLNKSNTYEPPSYLPAADDAASADDFRESLKAIGIKGASLRNMLIVLTSILKLGDVLGLLVDEDTLVACCEDVAGLLDLDPEVLLKRCTTDDREVFICAIYEALVDWVVARANDALRSEFSNTNTKVGDSASMSDDAGMNTPSTSEGGDSVSLTIIDIPSPVLGRAIALKTVFDDTTGINAEMKEDGVDITSVGSSINREMMLAISEVGYELGMHDSTPAKDREIEMDKREGVLEKVGADLDPTTFLRQLLYPVDGEGITLGKTGRFNLVNLMASSRIWFHVSLHPSDDSPATLTQSSHPWSAGAVSTQIRSWRLPEWANHRIRHLDYTIDFDVNEFVDRYSRLGCQPGRDGIEIWLMERGWSNGEVVIGKERIWMREHAWWDAETILDMKPIGNDGNHGIFSDLAATHLGGASPMEDPYYQSPFGDNASQSDMIARQQSLMGLSQGAARSVAPTIAPTIQHTGDYGLGMKGDDKRNIVTYHGEADPELNDGMHLEESSTTFGRRAWVAFVWAMTFWIPSFMLRIFGRMKRPDVRMAWREKLTLMFIILFINAFIVFYIIEFGRLLCPGWDKAWTRDEVSTHQGDNDYWVSHMGKVYDLSKFWKIQHSGNSAIQTTAANMQPFAGLDMTEYIQPPLVRACQGLVTDDRLSLMMWSPNNTIEYPQGQHLSGPLQSDSTSLLANIMWYEDVFLPKMMTMYKGDLVHKKKDIKAQGAAGRYIVIINNQVFDLSDYLYTLNYMTNIGAYDFLGDDIANLFQGNAGMDVTEEWNKLANATFRETAMPCMQRAFYAGRTDFRDTARCQANNYILLAFTIMLCAVILVKFLAALQLGSKRRPAMQDKFVICQVPAYTEGEDHLRKGLDSLTSLAYDNKRKLICVICDGMIVGGGNDRPTPKIVLDILGVDPKIDPPALPFKSVGAGSEQLNYGKVYSGLYEFEGNVVPYIVVVKVGKESEQNKSKPGNRGKRDSQILLMSFLNRVHHRSPMSPLELEMFHQINNIIGVDPELYEYLLMVDADTLVKEDSLNRLVAACANDAKIAGICGETSLENEERSWWTMIQVYEYYISHHLAKAFESLFGSVTCLPGCFCMYRLRTADKGKPLIISDQVIKEYSDCNVDTLHKKNLLSLGEDRYLTTLMTKHFPHMSYKFVPDAYALTAAPETWSVLLSQRRRWINSTIHNLAELVFLKDLCGFCCFSMRFVVFIDLFGTIILPATFGYLVYLIYKVATRTGQFPLISIIMLAAVYGLQALIFLIKRQWQHIGWMIIYILAFPIYSFVLPIYSFWKQDDFSWGNTRVVIGEKGNKKVVAVDDEPFNPRSIPLQRWEDYAEVNNLPGRRGTVYEEKQPITPYYDNNNAGYEMDDMHSSFGSIKPASTILSNMPQINTSYRPPSISPSPYTALNRQSTFSHLSNVAYPEDNNVISSGTHGEHTRLMSIGGMSDLGPYSRHNSTSLLPMDNNNNTSTIPRPASSSGLISRSRTPVSDHNLTLGQPLPMTSLSRPASSMSLGVPTILGHGRSGSLGATNMMNQPSDMEITQAVQQCLGEVDLDTVTKKQLKALTEQRLQCQVLGAERRAVLDKIIDSELANM